MPYMIEHKTMVSVFIISAITRLMNLAFQMRPQKVEEFIGQDHLIGTNGIVTRMLKEKHIPSLIFWGPPGCGKTTLALLIAHELDADFHHLSGVESGKSDLLQIVEKAQRNTLFQKQTLLFIDEIHRWNKAQQDVLLPHVESGLVILIGATTENPSFEIISPLLSRCKVLIFKSHTTEDLQKIITSALTDKLRGLGGYRKKIDEDGSELLIRLSGGDARTVLNALELAVKTYPEKIISKTIIMDVFQTKNSGLYDKSGEEHYNTISAFIKSMRGSDENASLYYLARMLEAGEDPLFIARRMIIFSSEDVGIADKGALILASSAFDAVHKVGMPEAQLILAHVVTYLAKAPKSRISTNALSKAKQLVLDFPNEPIPFHLRNAPTKLMKEIGYAKNYTWTDKFVGPTAKDSFMPEKLKNKKFF